MENLHVSKSEQDGWYFYEFQEIIRIYSEILEERNKNQESQQAEQEKKYGLDKLRNPSGMMKQAQSGMPKMPSMSGMKMPKMPKL